MNKIRRRLLALSIPLMLGFLLFYVFPLVSSFRYSFQASTFTTNYVGLKNYQITLKNSNFVLGLQNTAELLSICVPSLLFFSFGLVFIVKNHGTKHPILRTALVLPLLLPSTAVAEVFGMLSGLHPRVPIVLLFLWKYSGLFMLLFWAALSALPQAIIDAAKLDGANQIQTMRHIILPSISRTLLFATMLAIMYQLRAFREVYLIYGAYPDESLYLSQHYLNNNFHKLNYPKVTAASNLFLVVLSPLIAVGIHMSEKRRGGYFSWS